jgi:hypothetical protein
MVYYSYGYDLVSGAAYSSRNSHTIQSNTITSSSCLSSCIAITQPQVGKMMNLNANSNTFTSTQIEIGAFSIKSISLQATSVLSLDINLSGCTSSNTLALYMESVGSIISIGTIKIAGCTLSRNSDTAIISDLIYVYLGQLA